MTVHALGPALPEIILALGAIAMVLFGAIKGERSTRLLEYAAIALFGLALVLVLSGTGKAVTFNGGFVADGFARFMKALTLLGAAAAILLSSDSMRRDGSMRFEFPILIVLATIGMMMMISAGDLISLYVGLELQSLALYVVAAFDRDNTKSTEAGLKYFVLGALSSGMLLYGASLVYGFTGTVNYAGIAAAVQGGKPGRGLIFVIVFANKQPDAWETLVSAWRISLLKRKLPTSGQLVGRTSGHRQRVAITFQPPVSRTPHVTVTPACLRGRTFE